jgi:hypothetical protein
MRQLVLCWLLIAGVCTANVCAVTSVAAVEREATTKTVAASIETTQMSPAPSTESAEAKSAPTPHDPSSGICLNKEEIEAKQLEANRLFWKGDYKDCEKVCNTLATALGGRANIRNENVRPLYNQAICLILNEKISDAKPILQDLKGFLDKNKPRNWKSPMPMC